MPLKIYCKNIVKIVCTYHFLKKKKVECDNDIAEIGEEIFTNCHRVKQKKKCIGLRKH